MSFENLSITKNQSCTVAAHQGGSIPSSGGVEITCSLTCPNRCECDLLPVSMCYPCDRPGPGQGGTSATQ